MRRVLIEHILHLGRAILSEKVLTVHQVLVEHLFVFSGILMGKVEIDYC
jgi:hypothetical protein